jgi:hypothetical protein
MGDTQMFTLDRKTARKGTQKRIGSNFAMAVALMCGTALGVTALESPAQAQKKKKKKNKKDKTPKSTYSEAFVAAYQPVLDLTQGLVMDVAGAKAGIPAMVAAATTPDDKMAAGRLVANIGGEADDIKLRRQGYELMLGSGKASPEENPRFLYNSGQLAYADEDYATAQVRILAASEAGFEVKDLEHTISGLYFLQDRHVEGLAYLKEAIAASAARGEKPEEKLIQRGFSAAYNNDIQDEALAWTAMQVKYYPSDANWINVIALRREYFDENQNMILDLLRLQDRTAGLKNDRDFINYIEASNVRLPAELKRIVDKGLATGALQRNSVIVQEAQENLNARVAAVREDMAGLAADARKPNASSNIVTAAGNVFMSLERSAEAEEMFKIALGKSGVDANMVNTRLGIAQADQGKGAEAQATLAKVTGEYKNVADLWSAYAGHIAAPAPTVAVAAEPAM